MKKIQKSLCVILSIILLFLISTTTVFASTHIENNNPTEITATIYGTDNSKFRNNAYAVVRASTDIKDDNHAFVKDVEVWGVSKTRLQGWTSDTANGIPDWTLMAMGQLYVSNGNINYITSPTATAQDSTSVTATTKKVNAYDHGNASAIGYHTVKDVNGNITWTDETHAAETF